MTLGESVDIPPMLEIVTCGRVLDRPSNINMTSKNESNKELMLQFVTLQRVYLLRIRVLVKNKPIQVVLVRREGMVLVQVLVQCSKQSTRKPNGESAGVGCASTCMCVDCDGQLAGVACSVRT